MIHLVENNVKQSVNHQKLLAIFYPFLQIFLGLLKSAFASVMTFFLTSNLFSSSKFETVSNFDIDFSSSSFSREKLCTIFCGDNCLLNFSLVFSILGVNSTVVDLTEFSSLTVD